MAEIGKATLMTETYDEYYQTENLFGEPYPELIEFFTDYPKRGKVLDLGCGQGRNAIALARLGYTVSGIDISKVGIEQMNRAGQAEHLMLFGEVGDIYSFRPFNAFDIILMDSMFHFAKKDRKKESGLIRKIITEIKSASLVVFCIQDTGNKVLMLNKAIDFAKPMKRLADRSFRYTYRDKGNGHSSVTPYRMIVVEK